MRGIVFLLMQSLGIPIVPDLPKHSWAITATLLAAAVATPVMGGPGDMVGKRRMLLVSLVVLVAGSVIAALGDSLTPMIVGRALQGMTAGVVPLGISIMCDELPTERLSSATALMSASLGVGGALGLPAAAAIADNFDWHTLFWASSGAGALATALVLVFVPESQVRTGGRFGVVGAIGMAAGLVCLLLAISRAPTGAGPAAPPSACSPRPSWCCCCGALVRTAHQGCRAVRRRCRPSGRGRRPRRSHGGGGRDWAVSTNCLQHAISASRTARWRVRRTLIGLSVVSLPQCTGPR